MTTPRDALLWATIEDYAGLWELEWELNSLEGAAPKGRNRQPARDLLGDLLERGWVGLYWSEEPDGNLTPIPSEQSVRDAGR